VDPLHLSPEARRSIQVARLRRRRQRRLLRARRTESPTAWKLSRLLRPTPSLRRIGPLPNPD
jgi:hypothetical protein